VLFDGGNQSGMLGNCTGRRAPVIERASAHGSRWSASHNIWMSGRSAYIRSRWCAGRLVGIHTGGPAPPMSRRLRRQGKPHQSDAFGFPMDGRSAGDRPGHLGVMGTDLQFRQRLGIPLPEAWRSTSTAVPPRTRGPRDAARSLPSAGTRATRWRSRCMRSA